MIKTLALVVTSIISFSGLASALSIEQTVLAKQMEDLILIKVVTLRITEVCPEFGPSDKALNDRRDYLTGIAKTKFSSNQDFLEAAGVGNQEKASNKLQKFFYDYGVKWDSSEKMYCELANALILTKSPFSEFLIKK